MQIRTVTARPAAGVVVEFEDGGGAAVEFRPSLHAILDYRRFQREALQQTGRLFTFPPCEALSRRNANAAFRRHLQHLLSLNAFTPTNPQAPAAAGALGNIITKIA